MTAVVLVLALFVSVAIGTAAAILAWRQRPEPGATPLVGLLVGQTWWSTCIVFRLQATTLGTKLIWTDLAWVGVVVIPVAWLLLALEYTGRDQYVRPRYVAVLAIVPAVTVVLALVEPRHPLLYVRVRTAGAGTVQITQGGTWFWVIAAYTYLLGILGMLPLADVVTSDAVTFREQGAVLVVGLLAPWVTNVLYLAGVLPTAGIDPTPVAFSVSGVAYLYAITRTRFLAASPAPNRRARRLLFEGMRQGAVVVDRNDHVVDVNGRGAEILDLEPRDALGRPAGEVIPEYERLPENGTLDGHLTVTAGSDGKAYDVTAIRIENVRNRTIGRIITFHDVSRYLRQQQRLEVLNRILRHNIRTETSLIHGYAEEVTDEEGGLLQERALRIAEIGRKGREAIDLFEADPGGSRPRSLVSLLRHHAESVREEHPVTVEFDPPDRDVEVAGLLTHVFSNAVENAAEHNTGDDPHVRVSAEVADGRARVRIADDGPGIPRHEIEVLEAGTETGLKHGSGMGLWIIKWGTEIAGGDVRFEENEPTGTVVTVEVPVFSDPAGA